MTPHEGLARTARLRTHTPLAQTLGSFLVEEGATHAYGVIGGACAVLATGLDAAGLELVHARHEAGAVFQATEGSLATERVGVVFLTTGPGLLNALNGIAAAKWDGARVVVVSAVTAPASRGRWAVQETSPYTLPHDPFYASGHLFDYALCIEDAAELAEVRARLAAGLARPQGFVAHVAVPVSLMEAPVAPLSGRSPVSMAVTGVDPLDAARIAQLLREGPSAMLVGYGARHANVAVQRLAERLGAYVLATPRAKGVMPEHHPLYAGVTGAGGHASMREMMTSVRPRHLLVLGTRLGEASTFWDPVLIPEGGLIHVDLDPCAIGAAYPEATTYGVVAEIGSFLRTLHEVLDDVAGPAVTETFSVFPEAPVADERAPVRHAVLFGIVQRLVVEATDAVVMTDSGNAFGFGNHYLHFDRPGRYRTSAAWGTMGQMVGGVVGAAQMTGKKAVAIVGDGAMLMNNEVSTAVRVGADCLWIVLNDARYGIVRTGMAMQGLVPLGTDIPPVDFALFARSMGAESMQVEHEDDVEAALRHALAHQGPFVLDVKMDREAVSPTVAARVRSLKAQATVELRGILG